MDKAEAVRSIFGRFPRGDRPGRSRVVHPVGEETALIVAGGVGWSGGVAPNLTTAEDDHPIRFHRIPRRDQSRDRHPRQLVLQRPTARRGHSAAGPEDGPRWAAALFRKASALQARSKRSGGMRAELRGVALRSGRLVGLHQPATGLRSSRASPARTQQRGQARSRRRKQWGNPGVRTMVVEMFQGMMHRQPGQHGLKRWMPTPSDPGLSAADL
jgi:hypothetical protein